MKGQAQSGQRCNSAATDLLNAEVCWRVALAFYRQEGSDGEKTPRLQLADFALQVSPSRLSTSTLHDC